MKRRQFLAAASVGPALALPAFHSSAKAGDPQSNRTVWRVRQSEGLDAVAFLGALSGGELYLEYYADEVAEFAPRLHAEVQDDIVLLRRQLDQSGVGLLWPAIARAASSTEITSIDSLIAAFADPEAILKPGLLDGPAWNGREWAQLTATAPRLVAMFTVIRDAGFAEFRRELAGAALDRREEVLVHALAPFDLITLEHKLTAIEFDPQIDIILLHFSKPHGVRVLGQQFIQSVDYSVATTLRVAAHEMLHPPIDMDGEVANAVQARLESDPLIMRIVREHDPKWGYTTLPGYLNENICQALDQMASEELGVAHNPADRWNDSDDGMHVLAAALYGMLRQDNWQENGGDIEEWLRRALVSGRLDPSILHPMAAYVLGRDPANLWPLPAET